MTEPKRYWMTLVDRDAPAGVRPEFPTHPETDALATRRAFLKTAGFSFAGLAAADCGSAPQFALPHTEQPELTPGRGYSYASTCGACEAACGLLVTTHDGRPTKIEGNPDHPLSGGATCAVGQASVLGLYDSLRLTYPTRGGVRTTWADVDAEVLVALGSARQDGRAVRLLTGTTTSPTTSALIRTLVASVPNGRHVVYDPVSSSAIPDAYLVTHGVRLLPHYRFGDADVVVSFEADFLGTWIAPVEFTRGYTARRRAGEQGASGSAYHVQLESRLSLTGSKADRRIRVAPGDAGHIASHVALRLSMLAGAPLPWTLEEAAVDRTVLDELAERLWASRGRALVVTSAQDVGTQVVCNLINQLLGSYGTTIDLDRPSNQRQGNDGDLQALRAELARGEVAVLIVAGVNPVYDLPDSTGLVRDLERAEYLVSVADRLDETARLAHVVCPDHHYLESWGDAEPVAGVVSLSQPTIRPMGDTRAFIESLTAWSGVPQSAYDAVRANWEQVIFPRARATDLFPAFWNRTLERGVVELTPTAEAPLVFSGDGLSPVDRVAADAGALALVLYPKVAMRDGRHAHNAWLHEMPDPVTKVTWDNYASVSPATAERLGVSDGDVVRVASDDLMVELPAFVQPGQHDGAVAVALGYGRAGTERFNNVGPSWLQARTREGPVGRSAAPFVVAGDGGRRYDGRRITVTKTERRHRLASTQEQHSLAVPGAVAPIGASEISVVQETSVAALGRGGHPHEPHAELWPRDHQYPGHRWGMTIDLDSCTGCSACVVACQVENNVPVVGPDEVSRHRAMHWLRIDRYYAGDDENVTVAHQPMLCQHCEQAPCEVVCPVLATVHSSEGLNEQVYNRCVGTRYCANNCPYKVRRFNWFDYPREDVTANLVLNPNVTVRSRGVMEKCSLCVQRIEEGKIDASRNGAAVVDGAIKTACQQSCPAEAIVFGDLNDPQSRVSTLAAGGRTYRVLEELNTRPAVQYLKIVRRDEDESRG